MLFRKTYYISFSDFIQVPQYMVNKKSKLNGEQGTTAHMLRFCLPLFITYC